jgi:predicted metalloprotease with PDZ domain
VKPSEWKAKGWLGVTLKGNSTIASVLDDSPAMQAGLYPDDDIAALDGYRIDGQGLIVRCEEKKPLEWIRLAIFRRDLLLELPVRLGVKPADAAYLARVEAPTDAQRAAYRRWLNAPWDEAELAPAPTSS